MPSIKREIIEFPATENKIQHITNHIKNTIESGVEKLIVFTYWIKTFSALIEEFKKRSESIYSKSTYEERTEAITRFHEDPSCSIFITTIPISVMGLNDLTNASHIVIAEFNQKLTINDIIQAEGRAWYIGRKDPLTIQFLLPKKSPESSLVRSIIESQESIVGLGEDASLTDEELARMMAAGKNR